jgi:hypothetical protein
LYSNYSELLFIIKIENPILLICNNIVGRFFLNVLYFVDIPMLDCNESPILILQFYY